MKLLRINRVINWFLVSGAPHGHTGHVRFITCVEMTTPPKSDPRPKMNRYTFDTTKVQQNNINHGKILVISGGDGYEDFRGPQASAELQAGREDSTNHLLLWKVWYSSNRLRVRKIIHERRHDTPSESSHVLWQKEKPLGKSSLGFLNFLLEPMENTLPFEGSDFLPVKFNLSATGWLGKERKKERKTLLNGLGLGSTLEVRSLANFFIGEKESKWGGCKSPKLEANFPKGVFRSLALTVKSSA